MNSPLVEEAQRVAEEVLDRHPESLAYHERMYGPQAGEPNEVILARAFIDRNEQGEQWKQGMIEQSAKRHIAEQERDALARSVEELEGLRKSLRPEPYIGIRNPLCLDCAGRTMVSGKNHDDQRWLPCLTCDGTGLADHIRQALQPSEERK